MTHTNVILRGLERQVGRGYDPMKVLRAMNEEDEAEPEYTVCDCGERVEFGQTLSGMSGMCDGGHIWWRGDGEEWKSVNLIDSHNGVQTVQGIWE